MSKLTLSAVGLSPQEGTVVNVVANLMAALDLSVKVLDAGDITGDIVLIGHSSEAGRVALGNLGKEQHAVLFIDSEGDARGYTTLMRPVRVQTLRDLLVDLVPRFPARPHAAVQPNPAAPVTSAATGSATTSVLPGNLFYLLVDAVQNRSMLRIEHKGNIVLVHGPTQCIYTTADGSALTQMASQEPVALLTQKLAESDFMRAAKGMPLTRLHDLIWLAERHGSRGALLPGHSIDVPVRLKVWPKFNNRHVRPEYLKLAALLSKQALTLRALSGMSSVTLPHVIDFYNTSVAFGVIEKMETAPVVTPLAKPSTNSGLLGKIAKRLALKRD